jgi:hypothetical protein
VCRKAAACRFVPQPDSAQRCVQYALDHVFERVSVANDFHIMMHALRHSRGEATLAEIKGHLTELEAKGRIIVHNGEIATEESLQREKSMIGMIDNGAGRFTPLQDSNNSSRATGSIPSKRRRSNSCSIRAI